MFVSILNDFVYDRLLIVIPLEIVPIEFSLKQKDLLRLHFASVEKIFLAEQMKEKPCFHRPVVW